MKNQIPYSDFLTAKAKLAPTCVFDEIEANTSNLFNLEEIEIAVAA